MEAAIPNPLTTEEIDALNKEIQEFIGIVSGANPNKELILSSACQLLPNFERFLSGPVSGLDVFTYTRSKDKFNVKMTELISSLEGDQDSIDLLNALTEILARAERASQEAITARSASPVVGGIGGVGELPRTSSAQPSPTALATTTVSKAVDGSSSLAPPPPPKRGVLPSISTPTAGVVDGSSSLAPPPPKRGGVLPFKVELEGGYRFKFKDIESKDYLSVPRASYKSEKRFIPTNEGSPHSVLANIGNYFNNTKSLVKKSPDKEGSRKQVRLLFWDLIDLIGNVPQLKEAVKYSQLKIEPKDKGGIISSASEIKIKGREVKKNIDGEEGILRKGRLFYSSTYSPIKGSTLQYWVKEILDVFARERAKGFMDKAPMEAFEAKYGISTINDMKILCSGRPHTATQIALPVTKSKALNSHAGAASAKIPLLPLSSRTGRAVIGDTSAAAHASKLASSEFVSDKTREAPRGDSFFNKEDLENLNKCIADAYLECFKETNRDAVDKANSIQIHPGKLIKFLNKELDFKDLAFYRETDDGYKLFSIETTFKTTRPKKYSVIKDSIEKELGKLRYIMKDSRLVPSKSGKMTGVGGAGSSAAFGMSHSGNYTHESFSEADLEKAYGAGHLSSGQERRRQSFSPAVRGAGSPSNVVLKKQVEGRRYTRFASKSRGSADYDREVFDSSIGRSSYSDSVGSDEDEEVLRRALATSIFPTHKSVEMKGIGGAVSSGGVEMSHLEHVAHYRSSETDSRLDALQPQRAQRFSSTPRKDSEHLRAFRGEVGHVEGGESLNHLAPYRSFVGHQTPSSNFNPIQGEASFPPRKRGLVIGRGGDQQQLPSRYRTKEKANSLN
jgi:hypothetical protein